MRMGKSAFILLTIALILLVFLLLIPYTGALIVYIYKTIGFSNTDAIILTFITYMVLFFIDFYTLSGFKIIKEWERVPVLRLGKYIGLLGPGFIHIWRGFESYVTTIDLRTTGLSVRSEKTLTKDNVPIDVDAVIYWRVIDPEKAVLNITSYSDMVSYVSQTTLREVIGEFELDYIIAGREKISKRLRELIDMKTEEWGVEVISVELRDIRIPDELQDAMSRQAQAEREKRARVILASAENEAADQFLEAAEKYEKKAVALELRWMNILYELGISGKGNLIFVPSWMPEMKFRPLQDMGILKIRDMVKENEEKEESMEKSKGKGE